MAHHFYPLQHPIQSYSSSIKKCCMIKNIKIPKKRKTWAKNKHLTKKGNISHCVRVLRSNLKADSEGALTVHDSSQRHTVVTFLLVPWLSVCIIDLSSCPHLSLYFSFPQGCSLALSCATASTFLGTWATSRWAVPSTRAPPRCWSTSAVNFTSTLWKERSAPTRWTTCRTMRCCERCGGDLKGDGFVTVNCWSNCPNAALDAADFGHVNSGNGRVI